MATLTVYPAATATSPIDGNISVQGADVSFATLRAAAGTNVTSHPGGVANAVLLYSTGTSNQYSQLYRSIYCFDTSALGSSSIISSAVFSLYGAEKNNFLGSPALHIAGATPTSTSELVTGDFVNIARTSFGNIAYADFNASGYNDITLNATGLASISKTGITKFSAQSSWDLDNNFDGAWASTTYTNFYCYFAAGDPAKDPKLVITYTTTNNFFSIL